MNFIITVAWALLWQINVQALKKRAFWPILLTKEQKGHACPGTEPACWTETKKTLVCRVDKYQERIPSYYVPNFNYTSITFKIITDSWSFPCSLSLNSDSRSYFLTIPNWSPFLHLPQEWSAVKFIQQHALTSKMGNQITHKAATCEHTC